MRRPIGASITYIVAIILYRLVNLIQNWVLYESYVPPHSQEQETRLNLKREIALPNPPSPYYITLIRQISALLHPSRKLIRYYAQLDGLYPRSLS
jgi:hypothetical protein